jgi:hypothetical protein
MPLFNLSQNVQNKRLYFILNAIYKNKGNAEKL